MLSYTTLYLLFVVFAVLLFNVMIVMMRFSKQIQEAPEEEEYQKLEEHKKELEKQIQMKNQEIVDLKVRLSELGHGENPEEASAKA